MKPSEALRIAREKIESGEYYHICYVLPRSDGGSIVKSYIRSALSPRSSYDGWMYYKYLRTYARMSEHDLREGRLQWIDWMIKEYERIGQ